MHHELVIIISLRIGRKTCHLGRGRVPESTHRVSFFPCVFSQSSTPQIYHLRLQPERLDERRIGKLSEGRKPVLLPSSHRHQFLFYGELRSLMSTILSTVN